MAETEVDARVKETESLVMSLLPFDQDNKKARFIGYRASGFSIREACQLVGIHEKTLRRWRDSTGQFYDDHFVEAESQLPELRKTLGTEYAHLEFLRNYRLVLEKDFSVLSKSIRQPTTLTQQEHQYLLKARSHYSPQYLQILQEMISGKDGKREFDFTSFILSMERNKEKITLTGTKQPQLTVPEEE